MALFIWFYRSGTTLSLFQFHDLISRRFYSFLIRFLFYYVIIYYGTYAVIGLSAPEGRLYSPIVHRYMDYPSFLRSGLMYGTFYTLKILRYEPEIDPPFKVRLSDGYGVKIVYSCLGIGLMSFWIAFILANETSARLKILYLFSGISAIFLINTIRLVLLVLAVNGQWKWSVNADHHTLFNIASYVLIFIMMFLFDRNERRRLLKKEQRFPPTHAS